ncbi:glycosyltransferase involved in cell wall biosynthesis [Dysgonomonas hofstadii]|uniref:Glycosyltransferase involved in cell wall biosynthesis n=1 Tax=Dysgonomonas hofstadii TaxID=637886 RepID=A0A840CTN1_9BACT|nr:glycosyltransferase [Dysgonomonas hofstadii]MBB4035063.1 glycosyltransferase involved in cell wall biosynthesis [Dysgonomonas hofstadii]
MKINVILITYNHANYIRQAVESILMQETGHEVEIIVADDCSPDNTVDIIREYESKTSFSFIYLQKEHNVGYNKNYRLAFAACTGDYVAIMEGDDYWIKSNHLQNHINFLEQQYCCSMSYNRHLRLFEDQNREELFDWESNIDYERITTEQLALGNRIGNLSCCVFRGEYIRNIDPKLFDMEIADWMLGMYMGQFGPLLYLKEVTSAYRIHDNGQWSRMDEKEQFIRIIELINEYDKYFNYKYTEVFTKHKRRLEILLYGDKSLKGRIKNITPAFIRSIYRKIVN